MILVLLFTGILSIPVLLWLYSWYISEIPKHYTKKGTKLHSKIEKNLMLLKERYHPSWWCPFGTSQTVVRQLFRDCPHLPFEREIVEFEDGGAAGIDWLIPEGADESAPIIIFLPGITGSTHDSSYILHPVIEARDKGWKSLVVNPRGLGGVKLRTPKTYNAATTEDLAYILELVTERYPKAKKIGCGFSMGGMILWNYLAKVGDAANVDGAMIISSPWDPMITSHSLEKFIPRILFNRFIVNNLIRIVAPHRDLFENREGAPKVDFDEVLKCKSLRAFDTSFTTPMFGYENYEAYYETAAMHKKVSKICRPVVTLNAVDDVFSPVEGIPIEDMQESENVIGIITNHGGHTAFMESADPNARGMVEKLLSQWGNMIIHDYN